LGVTISVPLKATSTSSTSTIATIEVDVMPFLGRTNEGGPHDKAFYWLSKLGADKVRFAPWCDFK
jgi:hypothetical protein